MLKAHQVMVRPGHVLKATLLEVGSDRYGDSHGKVSWADVDVGASDQPNVDMTDSLLHLNVQHLSAL
jgi:hypothetical protein